MVNEIFEYLALILLVLGIIGYFGIKPKVPDVKLHKKGGSSAATPPPTEESGGK